MMFGPTAILMNPDIGRWSRLAAREFLDWLALPAGLNWLDVGCGTGALSEAILQLCSPAAIKGIDGSEGYIAFLRNKIRDPSCGVLYGRCSGLAGGKRNL